MPRLLQLMTERNNYLVRYYNLNEREMRLYRVANFDSLDAFYETREAILDVVSALDEKIDDELMTATVEEVGNHQGEIAELLSEKDAIVGKVLDQDLQILSLIETEKNKVLKEYMETKSNKKAVGAYKSGGVKRTFEQEA
jgi:hypothetical protein